MLLTDLSEEFKFNCQCRRLSDKTTANYGRLIGYLLKYLQETHSINQLEDVTARHIKQFMILQQKRGRKPQYINDLLKAHKCFFKYLHEEGYTDTNVADSVKRVRQPKVIIQPFNESEVKRMINHFDGLDYLSIRNKVIIMMFFDTGIRANELLTLKNDQIKEDYILIHGKGEKERVVSKSPILSKWLFKYTNTRNSYFADRVVKYANVFLSRNGKPLTHEAIAKVMRDAGIACNVRPEVRCSPHTCRHTFAQMQLQNGLDIYALSRLLGHESISITQRYLEGMKDKQVLKAGTKTSPLMNL